MVACCICPGANPSAEEQTEALEDGAKQVNNVVHSFRLVTTSFDKKQYLSYLKVGRDMDSIENQTNISPWLRVT